MGNSRRRAGISAENIKNVKRQIIDCEESWGERKTEDDSDITKRKMKKEKHQAKNSMGWKLLQYLRDFFY